MQVAILPSSVIAYFKIEKGRRVAARWISPWGRNTKIFAIFCKKPNSRHTPDPGGSPCTLPGGGGGGRRVQVDQPSGEESERLVEG